MTTQKTQQTHSVEETIALGKAIGAQLHAGDIVTLNGDLGAGKTHFTKGVALSLCINEDITSPTFPILLEYEGTDVNGNQQTLLHFDFYRLESEEQLEDIGWYEFCESGAIVLVEWADMFPDALPDKRLDIYVTLGEDGTRTFTFTDKR